MPNSFSIAQLIVIVTESKSPPWRLSDVARAYQVSTLSCRSVLSNVEGKRMYRSLVTGQGNYFHDVTPGAMLIIRWKLQVFGVSAQPPFQAWLLAWQDYDASGTWHGGRLLPGQTEESSYIQLVTGLHDFDSLQVIGLGTDGFVYLVASQDNGGNWSPGPAAPISGQNIRFSQLVTGLGNSFFIQVVGLGLDGLAYLAAWLDGNGAWHAGSPLPGNGLRFSQLITGNQPKVDPSGNETWPNLQVIGLGQEDGLAYQAAWQDETGNWHSGVQLPGQTMRLSQLLSLSGVVDGIAGLQILGLGQDDGLVYLAGWLDWSGNWHSGQLPVRGAKCSRLAAVQYSDFGESSCIVGLGVDDGLAYSVLLQGFGGAWQAGAMLPCQKWFAELIVDASRPGHLQVIGRDALGLAYQVAWLDGSGSWQSGGPLPNAA
jgi:hypothetical protein